MRIAVVPILLIQACLYAQGLPLVDRAGVLFAGSGKCAQCHSSDGTALTEEGADISMPTQWRATMMANSARDPLWRAAVSAEVQELPELSEQIETKCASCHAPMGKVQAAFDGASTYTMATLAADPLAQDGVSCTVCHQIQDRGLGTPESFSAGYVITDTALLFGPYHLTRNMIGYTALYGEQVEKSGLCASCHMVITPSVNQSGEIVGAFAEQVPFYEWLNSDYPAKGTTCQGCHMPGTANPTVIATNAKDTHSPFAYHHFVGANIGGLRVMRNNIVSLGLTADLHHFDGTIQRTERNLRGAARLGVAHQTDANMLRLAVAVENRAGHKLPTGIPLRRMWLHVRVVDTEGAVVFESGGTDKTGEIAGIDSPYEPHHTVIGNQGDVQIYEGIMQDVSGTVTNTLLRAASFAKDNRIPPAGFSRTHQVYDTVAIIGEASRDADFNADGSGIDTVHYEITLLSQGVCTVQVALCYQSVRPSYVRHLGEFSGDEIATFTALSSGESIAPFVIDSATVVTEAPTGAAGAAARRRGEAGLVRVRAVVGVRPAKQPGMSRMELFAPDGRRLTGGSADGVGGVVIIRERAP